MAEPSQPPQSIASGTYPPPHFKPALRVDTAYSKDGYAFDRSNFNKADTWTTGPLDNRAGVPPEEVCAELARKRFPVDPAKYAVRLPDDAEGKARWTWHYPMYIATMSRFQFNVHRASRDWKQLQKRHAAEERRRLAVEREAKRQKIAIEGVEQVPQRADSPQGVEYAADTGRGVDKQIKEATGLQRPSDIAPEMPKQIQVGQSAAEGKPNATAEAARPRQRQVAAKAPRSMSMQTPRIQAANTQSPMGPIAVDQTTNLQMAAPQATDMQLRGAQTPGSHQSLDVRMASTTPFMTQSQAQSHQTIDSEAIMSSSPAPENPEAALPGNKKDRCTRCIDMRKGCDTLRPVCGRCASMGVGPEGCKPIGAGPRPRTASRQSNATPIRGKKIMDYASHAETPSKQEAAPKPHATPDTPQSSADADARKPNRSSGGRRSRQDEEEDEFVPEGFNASRSNRPSTSKKPSRKASENREKPDAAARPPPAAPAFAQTQPAMTTAMSTRSGDAKQAGSGIVVAGPDTAPPYSQPAVSATKPPKSANAKRAKPKPTASEPLPALTAPQTGTDNSKPMSTRRGDKNQVRGTTAVPDPASGSTVPLTTEEKAKSKATSNKKGSKPGPYNEIPQPSVVTESNGIITLSLTSSFSDGTGAKTHKGEEWTEDPEWLNKNLALFWAKQLGIKKPNQEYRLERLPDGFTVYRRERLNASGVHVDHDVFGVSKGRGWLQTTNQFWEHFVWMMNEGQGDCKCDSCSKGTAKNPIRKSGGAGASAATPKSSRAATAQQRPSVKPRWSKADATSPESNVSTPTNAQRTRLLHSQTASGGSVGRDRRKDFMTAHSSPQTGSLMGYGTPTQQATRNGSPVIDDFFVDGDGDQIMRE